MNTINLDAKYITEASARLTTARPNLWSMSFMSSQELARYAVERGVKVEKWNDLNPAFVEWLWQLGLLRADFVLGRKRSYEALTDPDISWTTPLKQPGLEPVGL